MTEGAAIVKDGAKSSEAWITGGVILVVVLAATVAMVLGKITSDQWREMITVVSTVLGGIYTTGRTVIKTAAAIKK